MSHDDHSTMHPKYFYKFHPVTRLDQDPPVQNTWYPVFEGTGGLRIRMVTAKQANNELAAKDIEFRMTIDGVPIDATVTSQANNIWNYWYLGPGVERVVGTINIQNIQYTVAIECQEVLVEMRMTSVPGTTQTLDGRVHYETLERVQS